MTITTPYCPVCMDEGCDYCDGTADYHMALVESDDWPLDTEPTS